MKLRLAAIAALITLAGCAAKEPPLYTMTEQQVADYLPVAREKVPALNERVVHLGRRNIGQPYEIYLLGEYPYEPYDTDPLYCLQRSDCLTFAEHMYAMAYGDDWWTFMRALQRIRYNEGRIGMLTRNHYTVAEWNRNNAFLFEDLTTSLGDGTVHVPLTQVCRRSPFFKQFGIGQGIPEEPIEDSYIPKDRVPEVTGQLRDGDFVNIIRGSQDSQWCGHTGLVAIGADGTANFLHSAWPSVREEPLTGYLQRDRRSLGIKILRLRDDAEARLAAAIDEPQVTPVGPEVFAAALADAPPHRRDWRHAFALQSYRLRSDSPRDPRLQRDLADIDARIRADLAITGPTACGVLDLRSLRLAMVRPERMFYAASVGKLAVLLTYFAENPEAALDLDPQVHDDLARMTKRSENPVSNEYGRALGLDTIRETLTARRYRLYDEEQGGGLWCGQHYDFDEEGAVPDPVAGHTHGANVLQALRFFLMLEQGRLVTPQASARMAAILATPELDHLSHKFCKGLAGRDLRILRKSGTGNDWHLDAARIEGPDRTYLLVGMAHDPAGEEYLRRLAAAVDDFLADRSETVADSR